MEAYALLYNIFSSLSEIFPITHIQTHTQARTHIYTEFHFMPISYLGIIFKTKQLWIYFLHWDMATWLIRCRKKLKIFLQLYTLFLWYLRLFSHQFMFLLQNLHFSVQCYTYFSPHTHTLSSVFIIEHLTVGMILLYREGKKKNISHYSSMII